MKPAKPRAPAAFRLGSDDVLIAPTLDAPPNQFFILEWAVHVGGVEEVESPLQG